MRVLHVSPYFAPATRYGGPPASILGLCHGLQRAGVSVEVVTTTANGPSPLPASSAAGGSFEGVPVRYVPRAFPRRFFGGRLRAPLEDALSRADLCHIHGIWNVPEWRASRLARDRGVPYIVSPRGMLQDEARRIGRVRKAIAWRILERESLRAAACLHATSEQEAQALRALGLGVPIAVVPNGVDADAADAARSGWRRTRGIPEDAYVVLFLGRLHRIKRLDLLAAAFAELRASVPAAHLVLAGADEQGLTPGLKAALGSHAAALHALGEVTGDEKWRMLRESSVLVLCSDSESFGLAVAEALAAGVPAVVTKTCPWPDIETEGCGLWIEQDARAIAAALRRLADDAELRRRMGARGRLVARERYDWSAIGVAMRRVYDSVSDKTIHRVA